MAILAVGSIWDGFLKVRCRIGKGLRQKVAMEPIILLRPTYHIAGKNLASMVLLMPSGQGDSVLALS